MNEFVDDDGSLEESESGEGQPEEATTMEPNPQKPTFGANTCHSHHNNHAQVSMSEANQLSAEIRIENDTRLAAERSERELALLQAKVSIANELTQKLDGLVTAIADVSKEVRSEVNAQNLRLDQKLEDQIFRLDQKLEAQSKDLSKEIQRLDQKLEAQSKDLSKEIKDSYKEMDEKLSKKLDTQSKEIKELKNLLFLLTLVVVVIGLVGKIDAATILRLFKP